MDPLALLGWAFYAMTGTLLLAAVVVVLVGVAAGVVGFIVGE